MFNDKQGVSRIALTLITVVSLLHFSTAHSVPFNSELEISGSSEFNQAWSDGFEGNAGSFGIVSGGSATNSSFATDSSVTGTNPVTGALTDINDEVGFSSAGSLENGDYLASSLSSSMTLENKSSNSLFEVAVRFDYNHMVNADSDLIEAAFTPHGEAYLYSILELTNSFGSGSFRSELWSDTYELDYDENGLLSSYGEVISFSGSSLLTFFLNPSDILELDLIWAMEGEDFLGDGFLESSITTSMSIESVTATAVPLPGTLFLVGIGVILLTLQRSLRVYL